MSDYSLNDDSLMRIDENMSIEDENENQCTGCNYDIYGGCGMGMDYGKGGECYDG